MAIAARTRILINLFSPSSSEKISNPLQIRHFAARVSPTRPSKAATEVANSEENLEVPTEGISRPLSEILREIGKKVPDSFVKARVEDGQTIKYVPWDIYFHTTGSSTLTARLQLQRDRLQIMSSSATPKHSYHAIISFPLLSFPVLSEANAIINYIPPPSSPIFSSKASLKIN